MTIRKVDSPKPTTPPSTPTTQPAASNEPRANAPAEQKSSFQTSTQRPTELERADRSTAHVPLPSIAPGERGSAPGPLSLTSREAQAAVQTTVDYLNKAGAGKTGLAPTEDASKAFTPRNVERDDLGMTHVRMDRVHEGVKVFGEQVISHLDRDGKVASMTGETGVVPKGLGADPVKLTADQALAIGQREFNNKTTQPPQVERVIVQDKDGQYKAAYRVEMTNLSDRKPQRMNYMVDANSGQVIDKWNQMGGIELPLQKAAEPVTIRGAATPNAPINDNSTTTSTIKIDQDVDIQKLGVNLDIPHTYKGDLVVTLTSPSGKSAVIHNRSGGSGDNVQGKFDLSAFAGESSKGDWKLTVEDKAKMDTGTLKAWDIEITGTPKAPPSDTVTVTKTATPNAPIKDNQTVTSTIDVAEDIKVDQLGLDLDIPHTYKGDLVVTLTSPSGKSAVVHNRTGGSTDDVKGSFDLTAFAGEPAKGQWKLTVEDKARADEGTLKSWGLKITGKKGDNPPPPPPPPPPGGVDDQTLYSGKVELNTTRNADGSYTLTDSTRGSGVVTLDAQNKSRASNAVPFSDANNIWGEGSDGARTKAAVDAHYGAQMTYDMIKNVLGRDSLDGRGEKLISNVHISNNYVNAFWDGTQMNYGDGDGKDAGPLTTLDIAGHEIAHGLTERTAGLIYSGESGGLNEAMSDIMGTGVEWYASQRNSAVKFDYAVGEDAWTPNNGNPNDALRYMNDPTSDGYSVDHYSNYPKQTEVHGSSGIANNAFYLLTNGGTNRTSKITVEGGVGMDKGLKIYGRALTTYMTPKTTFAQAREACIKAATDLYGADSVEVQKVKESWTAVGVK